MEKVREMMTLCKNVCLFRFFKADKVKLEDKPGQSKTSFNQRVKICCRVYCCEADTDTWNQTESEL